MILPKITARFVAKMWPVLWSEIEKQKPDDPNEDRRRSAVRKLGEEDAIGRKKRKKNGRGVLFSLPNGLLGNCE